ncbi:hypothetical protein AMATHDRAFT_3908 [Amanita thiersii Skay4041]|uniref:Uncharacterized protein n=1 Tax=Amanita thiersii Skay4041 TaxID=703135 RepID=A0A2A9NS82_9AGAR|nr:hypothetical protein AMATHDRAFT_3908 [Amanita thiersii Skay4041]
MVKVGPPRAPKLEPTRSPANQSHRAQQDGILVAYVHLPNELLGIIFCFSMEDQKLEIPHDLGQDWRMGLLRVCSSWRHAALATSDLWSDIVIDLEAQPTRILALANKILSRAHGASLSITARMNGFQNRAPKNPSFDEFVSRIILPFASSIRALKLFVTFPFIKSFLSLPSTMDINFPNLELLSIRQASYGIITESSLKFNIQKLSLPRIKVLELNLHTPRLPKITETPLDFVHWSQITTLVMQRPISVELCYDILCTSPMLESFSVYMEQIPNRASLEALPRLTLSSLSRLHIRFTYPDFHLSFLSRFTFPSIRDLALKEEKIGFGWTVFLSNFLLNQCGPYLEHLFIAGSSDFRPHYTYDGFEEVIFKYSSTLRRLHMPLYPGDLPHHFIVSLVSRELCPQLESLSLEYCSYHGANNRMRAIMNNIGTKGREAVKDLYLPFPYPIDLYHLSYLKSHLRTFGFNPLDGYSYNPAAMEKWWFGYYA